MAENEGMKILQVGIAVFCVSAFSFVAAQQPGNLGVQPATTPAVNPLPNNDPLGTNAALPGTTPFGAVTPVDRLIPATTPFRATTPIPRASPVTSMSPSLTVSP
jgi:hypothetical protein